jgi:hypothetical protein
MFCSRIINNLIKSYIRLLIVQFVHRGKQIACEILPSHLAILALIKTAGISHAGSGGSAFLSWWPSARTARPQQTFEETPCF